MRSFLGPFYEDYPTLICRMWWFEDVSYFVRDDPRGFKNHLFSFYYNFSFKGPFVDLVRLSLKCACT